MDTINNLSIHELWIKDLDQVKNIKHDILKKNSSFWTFSKEDIYNISVFENNSLITYTTSGGRVITDYQGNLHAEYSYNSYNLITSGGNITSLLPSKNTYPDDYLISWTKTIDIYTMNSSSYKTLRLVNLDGTATSVFYELGDQVNQKANSLIGYVTWNKVSVS